ncbi:MAG: endonuclease domain-containing protein, partial [Candidatus Thiodiazotropha sp.]
APTARRVSSIASRLPGTTSLRFAFPGWQRMTMNQRDFAKTLRQNMTDAERLLWRHLRAHRYSGQKFRRQQPIGPYIVDFVHFKARLIIECDGGQHNESQYDRRRDAWLEAQGFKFLRFWNHEILNQTESVLSAIFAVLNPLSSRFNPLSPNPSPTRGEVNRGLSIRREKANQTNEPLPSQESSTSSDSSLPSKENSPPLTPLSPRGRGAGGEGGDRN